MSKSTEHKIEIIFLSLSLNICFWNSNEPSQCDGTFEYSQCMFWLSPVSNTCRPNRFTNSAYPHLTALQVNIL